MWKVVEAASTNVFFHHIQLIHIANQLYEDSYTSRTITSSQHHPRETRPLMSQPNLYKKRYTGIAYSEFVSYRTRKMSMFLLIHFFTFSYFFFSFLSTSYRIWSWVNPFAYSFFHIQLFLFSFLSTSYSIWNESIHLLIHFFIFSYFIFFPSTSYSIWNESIHLLIRVFTFSYFFFFFLSFHILYETSQSICLFIFSYSAISFSFLQLHILYETSQPICLFIFSYSAISFFFSSTSYSIWNESIHLLIRVFTFSYFFFFSFNFILYMKRVNPFAYSFFHIQLFHLFFLQLHILYETSQLICLFLFSHWANPFFLSFNFIFYMKLSQSICLFMFLHSANSFSFLQLHIVYETSQSICLFIFSYSAISFVFPSTSYSIWNESTHLLIPFFTLS